MRAIPAGRSGLLFSLFFVALVLAQPLSAQQTAGSKVDDGELSYEEKAAALEAEIDTLVADSERLEASLAEHEGDYARILERRIEETRLEALDRSHDLVELVIAREADGEDPGQYRDRAVELVEKIPADIQDHIDALIAVATTDSAAETGELKPAELVALEAQRERSTKRILALYEAMLRNLELSEQLGLDTTEQARFLSEALAGSAERLSVALELTKQQGSTLSRQIDTVPDDAELAARARINGERAKRLADSLRQTVSMMEKLELDVVGYRQQLIGAAGGVTTDIFDFDVFKGLVGNWFKSIGHWFTDNLPAILFNVLLFLLILSVAVTLSRIARRLVTRGLDRAPVQLSQLLRRMIISTAANLVLLLGLLFGLAQLGISVGPLLAGLGIAGFIVGFALQDTLGNFASGMLILLYRPYDVGDMIEAGGALGKVSHMSLVNTTILTVDNQTLVLPNSKIWGDVIKNVTAQRQRRIDLVFGIGYGDDIPKAEKVLTEIVESHSKVLDDPEPVVRLHTLNESSVDFIVRPWVKTEDYWDVYWDITRAVKLRFDEKDICIPFPQRDVHLFAGDKDALAAVAAPQIEQASVAPSGSQPRDDLEAGEADGGDNQTEQS